MPSGFWSRCGGATRCRLTVRITWPRFSQIAARKTWPARSSMRCSPTSRCSPRGPTQSTCWRSSRRKRASRPLRNRKRQPAGATPRRAGRPGGESVRRRPARCRPWCGNRFDGDRRRHRGRRHGTDSDPTDLRAGLDADRRPRQRAYRLPAGADPIAPQRDARIGLDRHFQTRQADAAAVSEIGKHLDRWRCGGRGDERRGENRSDNSRAPHGWDAFWGPVVGGRWSRKSPAPWEGSARDGRDVHPSRRRLPIRHDPT